MRTAPSVHLDPDQRHRLVDLAHSGPDRQRLALRAAVVLRAADGATNQQIARDLGTSPETAARWRQRFLAHGVPGLVEDAPRPGRPHQISATTVRSVMRATVRGRPDTGRRWTARSLAEASGISRSTVQRIWNAHGLRRRTEPDPRPDDGGLGFLERVTDLVGLYLHTPARALAFATDERMVPNPFRLQPKESSPPRRPVSVGAELRTFLEVTERETPEALDVHLLLDSRVAPIPIEVERWMSRHPRFHLHFLPADAGGLSLIDRLVDGFSRRKDRPGTSASANRLKYALREHLRRDRGSERAFVWTAASGDIRGAHGRWTLQQ